MNIFGAGSPYKPGLIGRPLHPIQEDEVRLVDGKLGNPILLNDDDIFLADSPDGRGGVFYLLVAAAKGLDPKTVATTLASQNRLYIRPFVPEDVVPELDDPTFDITIVAQDSYNYQDPRVRDRLSFRPDLKHLRAIYGEEVDYTMVACRLPNDRREMFGDDFRIVRYSWGQPTGENINTRKFDLVQELQTGVVEVMHRGGLVLFDRHTPAGIPDNLAGMMLSDLHIASANDEFEIQITSDLETATRAVAEGELLSAEEFALVLKGKRTSEDRYLRFNNANANLDAIVEFVNQEYRAGRVDWVMTLGDNVDYTGRSHEASRRLTDSNFYPLARALSRLEPPVFTMLGNHDLLPEAFPAKLTANNFNLTPEEMEVLEAARYGGEMGSLILFSDILESIMNDPSALIGYYNVINPYQDTVINWGKGTTGKESRFVMLDMGGADWAHFRQDDRLYAEQQFWPWGIPYLHVGTIADTVTHSSPDVVGPSYEQVSWLGTQIARPDAHFVTLTHPPLINSQGWHLEYAEERDGEGLQPVDVHEVLNFNTTAHGDQMLRVIADSPNVRLHLGGHAHFDGDPYALGINDVNSFAALRGPVRSALGALDPSDPQAVHAFYFPNEGVSDDRPKAVATLFGGGVGPEHALHNVKYTWQLGSAGVYSAAVDGKPTPPVFTRLTLSPEGLIAREEHFYVIKEIVPDALDASGQGYVVQRMVATAPIRNDEVLAAWQTLESNDPGRHLVVAAAIAASRDRLSTRDDSFLPYPQSLNDTPRYNDLIEHPYISDTKMDPHLRLRFSGSSWPGFDANGPTWQPGPYELGVEYAFSQDQIGPIRRSLLIEGVEAGWRGDANAGRFYLAWRLPTVVDLKTGEKTKLRAIGLSLGPAVGMGAAAPFSLHNELHVVEYERILTDDGLSLTLGLDINNVFGAGQWQWQTGITYTK